MAIGAVPRSSNRWLATAALGLLWLVYAGPGLFQSGLVPFSDDTAITYLPLREFFARRLHAGHLPGWFPYDGLGEPYIGQIVTATFHPQSLLYLFLPVFTALKWTIYLGGLFALVGAYRLARGVGGGRAAAVGAAAAYAFSGYAVSMTDNLPYLAGVATLPWVAWAGLRVARRATGRRVALLALVWALTFLGGDAQAFLVAPALLLAGWVAVCGTGRALAAMAGAGLLALLLCGAELAPALAIAAGSVRALWHGNVALESRWAFHPWRLPDLVAPIRMNGALLYVFSKAMAHDARGAWAGSIFCGAIALLAAATAIVSTRRRTVLSFGAVAAVAFWLALGGPGRLLPLAWRLLPILSSFRYPEKYLGLTMAALVPLVALGLDALLHHPKRGTVAAGLLGLVFLALALAFSQSWLGGTVGALSATVPGTGVTVRVGDAWAAGFATSGLFLLALAAILAVSQRHRRIGWLVPGLAAAELLWACAGSPRLLPRTLFTEGNPLAEAIRATATPPAPPGRVAISATALKVPPGAPGEAEDLLRSVFRLMYPSTGAHAGVGSFGVNLPGTQSRYMSVFGGDAATALAQAPRFNGCFSLLNDDVAAPPGSTRVAADATFGVALNRVPCNDRALLAQALSVPDEAGAASVLRQDLPLGEIVWEGGPARAQAVGSVRWVENDPDELRLEVETDRPAALYVADAFAPGWSASVDGAPAVIHPADIAARGVELPAGRHTVTMRYRVPNFAAGLAASILGLVLLIVLAASPRRRASAP